MHPYRAIRVRDCQGTLWAFYAEFQGALASFEGYLADLRIEDLTGVSLNPTASLPRQTLRPQLDFIIVPITTEIITALKVRLSGRDILGRHGKVIHTQIAVGGTTILIACDNFHHECTVVSSIVSEIFLARLKQQGVIRNYSDANVYWPNRRW